MYTQGLVMYIYLFYIINYYFPSMLDTRYLSKIMNHDFRLKKKNSIHGRI